MSRFGSRIYIYFFFIVATHLQINLCIKLSPLLVRMYCSDCLQQRRPNQNLLFRHISRERGPTHPFLCDVKSLCDVFIKPRLNSALSQKGFIVLIVFNKNGPIKIYYRRVYHEGDVKANHHLEKLFSFNGGHMYEFKTLICCFQKENKPFSSVNRNNNF